MTEATAPTFRFDIFMAGDFAQAKHVCREYAFEVGFCTTIEPLDFIYTGGEEAGFKIGIINYPRFPSDHDALLWHAKSLADKILVRLCQHSYSIVGPKDTYWFSRRSGA